jgi:hypothetical protein
MNAPGPSADVVRDTLTQPWSKSLDKGISGWYSGASNTKPSHPDRVANGGAPRAFDACLPAGVEGLAILRNPASL